MSRIKLKIIEPKVELITPRYNPSWAEQSIKLIEECGRVSHKSEGRITQTSALPFIKKIAINYGHESIIEHANFTACFIGSRAMSHQLVRHRIGAYTQECMAGDVQVRKGITVAHLYERGQTQYGKTHNKTIRLRSVNQEGAIVPNRMKRVVYKGVEDVFEVVTKLGYKIKTTLSHRFMLPDKSFVRLTDLAVGDSIMLNGRPSLLCIDDGTLSKAYLEQRLSPIEIAKKYDAPYGSVLRRLQQLQIFVKHLNDKNSEKYTSGHTPESYEKTRLASIGRPAWNKGLTENLHPSVKRQGDSLRRHHYNNQPGACNSNWKGGVSLYRNQKENIHNCELCGSGGYLEVHHIDKNRSDNSLSNLIKVCLNCHTKFHKGWHAGLIAHADKIESITYVGREKVYDIEMCAPLHNFIANGFVVHNSQRYCDYAKDSSDSCLQVIMPKSVMGSKCLWGETISESGPEGQLVLEYHDSPDLNVLLELNGVPTKEVVAGMGWIHTQLDSYKRYLSLRDSGVPSEDARSVLTNACKTEVYTTFNFRQWRHFFKMRMTKHAQWEIRMLAKQVFDYFKDTIPVIVEDLELC